MYNCSICNKNFETKKQITTHITKFHKISTKEYYQSFNDDIGLCTVCGEKTKFKNMFDGYSLYCSRSCAAKGTKQKAYNTLISKHGSLDKAYLVRNKKSEETLISKYGSVEESYLERTKNTKISNIEKYRVDNVFQLDEVKDKIKQSKILNSGSLHESYNIRNKKTRLTNLDKYGVEWYTQSDMFKESSSKTNIEKYSTNNYSKTKEYLIKCYETKKNNGTFNTSKPELLLGVYLRDNFKVIIEQFRSEEYPFNCDFYIKDLDLYIELQGSWTHGNEPFENTSDQKLILESWIKKSITSTYYKSAIKTWTDRDVLKRETAKKNSLNYLEIFDLNFNTLFDEIIQFKYLTLTVPFTILE